MNRIFLIELVILFLLSLLLSFYFHTLSDCLALGLFPWVGFRAQGDGDEDKVPNEVQGDDQGDGDEKEIPPEH